MASLTNTLLAYKFIKQLSTPWEEWDAYKLGLIDKEGRKIKKAETAKEKLAMPIWRTLIRNIKRFLEKLPFGATKLGSFAAALWLIKEELGGDDITPFETEFKNFINQQDILVENEQENEPSFIPAGKYTLGDELIYLKEDLYPIGQCFNQYIYKVQPLCATETYITKDQLITGQYNGSIYNY